MKRFLITVLIWTVGLAFFTFFLSNFFFDGQVYQAAMLAVIIFVVVLHGYQTQMENAKSHEAQTDERKKQTTSEDHETK